MEIWVTKPTLAKSLLSMTQLPLWLNNNKTTFPTLINASANLAWQFTPSHNKPYLAWGASIRSNSISTPFPWKASPSSWPLHEQIPRRLLGLSIDFYLMAASRCIVPLLGSGSFHLRPSSQADIAYPRILRLLHQNPSMQKSASNTRTQTQSKYPYTTR